MRAGAVVGRAVDVEAAARAYEVAELAFDEAGRAEQAALRPVAGVVRGVRGRAGRGGPGVAGVRGRGRQLTGARRWAGPAGLRAGRAVAPDHDATAGRWRDERASAAGSRRVRGGWWHGRDVHDLESAGAGAAEAARPAGGGDAPATVDRWSQ